MFDVTKVKPNLGQLFNNRIMASRNNSLNRDGKFPQNEPLFEDIFQMTNDFYITVKNIKT